MDRIKYNVADWLKEIDRQHRGEFSLLDWTRRAPMGQAGKIIALAVISYGAPSDVVAPLKKWLEEKH